MKEKAEAEKKTIKDSFGLGGSEEISAVSWHQSMLCMLCGVISD